MLYLLCRLHGRVRLSHHTAPKEQYSITTPTIPSAFHATLPSNANIVSICPIPTYQERFPNDVFSLSSSTSLFGAIHLKRFILLSTTISGPSPFLLVVTYHPLHESDVVIFRQVPINL